MIFHLLRNHSCNSPLDALDSQRLNNFFANALNLYENSVVDEELRKFNTFPIGRSIQFGTIGEEYMSCNIDKVLR